jgi:hypothetical protein
MAAISNKISQLTGVGKGKLFVKNDDDVVIVSAVRSAITKVGSGSFSLGSSVCIYDKK